MTEARNQVFRAAREYFGAVARYWRAILDGKDLEGPTQEIVGRGLTYRAALEAYMRQAPSARRLVAHRLEAIASQLKLASRHYKQHRENRAQR